MVSALVITLREGMEAALVTAIILTYLRRTGRLALSRYVYLGLGLAVLASIAAAIVLQAIGFDPENEYLEGALLGIGGIFVATMVLWMWRTARNLRRHLETRLGTIVTDEKTTRGAGAGLLAFTFFMVGREGVETVLFLAAATVGEAGVMDLIGGLLGIGLAVLFAVLFIRGSLRIDLKLFFSATTVVLLLLAIRLLMGSLHEFAEVGVIPMGATLMRLIGYFVRDRAADVLLMALITVPIVAVLWDSHRRAPAPAAAGGAPAELRKMRAAVRGQRMWRFGLVVTAVLIVVAVASSALSASAFIDPPSEPIAAADGEIRVDIADLQANDLRKFAAVVDGNEVRFLVVKLEDGTVLTALDACQICGPAGFMQEQGGGNAICKNCNAPIPVETLGLGGGCNPLPLRGRLEGPQVVISAAELEGRAAVFSKGS